jgi:hypothetical protein
MPRSREEWQDTDCAAGCGKSKLVPRFACRIRERHTCLRSDSISSSFCLICARRYSRLLKGKNEHSSSSGEEIEEVEEDSGEEGRYGIVGGRKRKWEGRRADN